MSESDPSEVTQLLRAMGEGDTAASDELLRTVYGELRRVARSQMRGAASGETLQPTALVNEAYLRLVGRQPTEWKSRRHFFFVAARAMHDILVEEARRKASRRRGGDWRRADAENLQVAIEAPAEDMLALAEALERLEAEDERKAQVVRLRFFAGLSEEETADVLGVHARTVRREWRFAKARLFRELGASAEGEA